MNYEAGKPPWIASRLQDFFGLRETPRIANGKVALVVHLAGAEQAPGANHHGPGRLLAAPLSASAARVEPPLSQARLAGRPILGPRRLEFMRRAVAALFLFGISFGYVEAAVVVYLRAIYDPIRARLHPERGPHDLFPLITPQQLADAGPENPRRLVDRDWTRSRNHGHAGRRGAGGGAQSARNGSPPSPSRSESGTSASMHS